MPGYVIHLAVGKVYSQNNKIKDLKSFEKGIIMPDLQKDKAKSHYGPYSSSPGLDEFINEEGIEDSFDEGYFLHLLTDYYFYNKFLDKWKPGIYDDYDKLNEELIKKYGIELSREIKDKVDFKEGELVILNKELIYKFINSVGKVNVRDIVSKREKNIKTEWEF